MLFSFMQKTKKSMEEKNNKVDKLRKKKTDKKRKKKTDKLHKNYNIINFCKSAYKNYQQSILIFLVCYYFTFPKIDIAFLTMIYSSFFIYIFHFMSHIKQIHILSSLHLYHHNSDTLFGFFNQFIFEIVTNLLIPLFVKYIFELTYINEYVILFYYLTYLTVHFINYSILRVNKVHEKHHSYDVNYSSINYNKTKNFGPDYADIFFGTKYKPETHMEDTSHKTLNICFSGLCIYILKYLWEKPENKRIMSYLYKIFATLSIGTYVLLYLSLPSLINDQGSL